jgi:signal transduction histidine kinase
VRSLRGTLTVWYTVALAAAVLAFGGVLAVLQQRANRRALEERLDEVSARVVQVLVQKAQSAPGTSLVDATFAPRVTQLRLDVQDRLSPIPGSVLVVDRDSLAVYGSPEVIRLSQAAKDQLRLRTYHMRGEHEAFGLMLDRAPYRFVARRVRLAGDELHAVAVGEPSRDQELVLQRLAASMILVVPVTLAFAALLGWFLASRALQPVSRIIDELEAITDGRSLHRRLPAPAMRLDELNRLANALNSLLSRLETSFSALRRFVADASHELKTPLTVMRAGVERALTEPRTGPEALVPLEETLQGVRHMTELVDALLTLARVDEGRMELHTEAMDLGTVLRETFETAQILGEEAGVEAILEVPERPVIVEADRRRIGQLVMNLVTNAVKYTPAGGRIWLSLAATDAAATIAVRDTGIGIAPGDVGRVFDRFWRADVARSRTGERPGFGLGLAIARWIAEVHGGSIAVTSRPGRGSTFTVTLPRVPAAVMESSSSGHSGDTGAV